MQLFSFATAPARDQTSTTVANNDTPGTPGHDIDGFREISEEEIAAAFGSDEPMSGLDISLIGVEMEVHPDAFRFPKMELDDFEAFCLDIAVNGQRERIMLAVDALDGKLKIADGLNRYNACRSLNRPAKYRKWDGRGNLRDATVSLNLKRRHLTESQRATFAAEVANAPAGRPSETTQICGVTSQTAAAHRFSVSTRLVSEAKGILDADFPELTEQVKTGKMKVSAAAPIAREIKKLSREEREKLIRRGRQAQRRKIEELKTQSLRQTVKGFGTCLNCNPELDWTDERVSAAAQRIEQRAKEAFRAGRAERDYGPYFEAIAFEIADILRGKLEETNQGKVLTLIDGSNKVDDQHHQIALGTDLQRLAGLSRSDFDATIAVMIDLNMIEAVQLGGTFGARGAKKTGYRRSIKASEPKPEVTYEVDEGDNEPDVYYDRWEFADKSPLDI